MRTDNQPSGDKTKPTISPTKPQPKEPTAKSNRISQVDRWNRRRVTEERTSQKKKSPKMNPMLITVTRIEAEIEPERKERWPRGGTKGKEVGETQKEAVVQQS